MIFNKLLRITPIMLNKDVFYDVKVIIFYKSNV